MEKNTKIGLIIIAVLVAGLLIIPGMNNINFNIMAVTFNPTTVPQTITGYTGTYNYVDSGAQYVHDKIRGKNILKGTSQELLDDTQYVTGWYTNGDSEKINIAVGNYEQVYTWNAGHDYIGSPRRPSQLVGRYWWDVYYYPSLTSAGTKIIGKTTYLTSYCIITSGSNTKQEFPNGVYNTDYSSKAPGGETRWWFPSPGPFDYSQTLTLKTGSLAFKMVGARTGYIQVNLVVEYCELSVWGLFNSVYGYHYDYKTVKTDMAELKSGLGDVDVTSKNSMSGVPGYDAGGTGDDYTKYLYNEGQTVTIHVKTGYSGQSTGQNTADKRWKFEILKGGTASVVSELLSDNWEGDKTWLIPIGTGNQDFTVRLTNGLIVQSESKIYSVKEISKVPGRTSITSPTNGATYQLGNSVTVKFSASPNPNTLSPIARFDGGAKYSPTGTYFWSSSTITATNNQGQFTITPTRTGNVYITVVPVDKAGFYGAENLDFFITVTSIPKYLVTVLVTDKTTSSAIDGATVILGSYTPQTTVNGVTQFTVETGTYTLTVAKSGYKTFTSTGNGISANKNIPVALESAIPSPDTDGDGIPDARDNCPDTYNPDQADTNGNGIGDVCEGIQTDTDEDGIPDISDNCPSTYNPDQTDTDGNGIGDVCDEIASIEYTIKITVSTDAGPLYGASVTLENISGTIDEGTTDADGLINLKALVGIYDLKITASGYHDHEESLVVVADEPKEVNMISSDIIVYDLTITVTSAKDNTPIIGAQVDVDGQTAFTGAQGMAILSNLESGSKSITVTKAGYTDATSEFELTDSTTTVTISMTGKGTPGFELISLIVAVGITLILLRRKNKKNREKKE